MKNRSVALKNVNEYTHNLYGDKMNNSKKIPLARLLQNEHPK